MNEDNEKDTVKHAASIHETAGGTQRPSMIRNYISYFGLAVTAASLTSFILLLLIALTGANDNPYTDLVTFILIPSILVFGLLSRSSACCGKGTGEER